MPQDRNSPLGRRRTRPSGADRPDAAAAGTGRARVPRRRDGLGGDQAASRPRRAGDWHCGGLRRRAGAAAVAAVETAAFSRSAGCRSTAYLATSRPTAVNLFWALDRMQGKGTALLDRRIDRRAARRHCWPKPARSTRKTAPSATPSAATAPSCSRTKAACSPTATPAAWPRPNTARPCPCSSPARTRASGCTSSSMKRGRSCKALALTAWELAQRGIDATLICDNMAGQVMREGKVQAVIVGADRIAANGDTANKIGTYSVAVLAAAHDIPFYVAAPSTTFDLSHRLRRADSHRRALPRRNHARLRPADRPRRHRRL